jgi:putative transcriptional regulator
MTPEKITAIRKRAGMTQEQLAHALRVSVGAVRSWEQGARKPGGPAVCMLEVLAREGKGGGK